MSISEEEIQEHTDPWDLSYDDRDLILSKLNNAIDKVHDKAMNGRASKNDKFRVQWFKTLAYMISIYNQVKKDADLEDLEKQVQQLAKQVNRME
ncbi:hypothetical protein [Methanobacterium sp. SMA-27]|uniref:hypothetical protein n=1 Tax=Methanobacterium sp. SMA-27 TaxID=1495336 RepID=UPI00064F4463|nr:hypothetical protein [Methanobacterium sp. SMA-27]